MQIDVTPKEAGIIQHLRALKNDTGFGTLQVSVTDGVESLVLRAHSVKDLTVDHPSIKTP